MSNFIINPFSVIPGGGGGLSESFADSFDRANQLLSASANWNTRVTGNHTQPEIQTNFLRFESGFGPSGFGSGIWADGSLADDQYAQMTWQSGGSGGEVGPVCRMSLSPLNGYGCVYDFKTSPSRLILYKFNNDVATSLGTYNVTLSNNDLVKVEAVGEDISAYLNDVQVITATDSDHASGGAGVYGKNRSNFSFVAMDSWSAGD